MAYSMIELRDIINKKYRDLSSSIGRPLDVFPYGFERDLIGGYYLELEGDGKISLVGTERNRETFRKQFGNIDDLVEWVFEDFEKMRDIQRGSVG